MMLEEYEPVKLKGIFEHTEQHHLAYLFIFPVIEVRADIGRFRLRSRDTGAGYVAG